MNRTVWFSIILVILIVIGGGLFMITKLTKTTNNATSNTASTSNDESTASNQTTDSNSPVTTNSIAITNFAFNPTIISVKKGTTVTWTNKDGATHTVTENDGKTGPNSENLVTGKSYSYTFDTVGTYNYHCTIHTSMTGTVVVTE